MHQSSVHPIEALAVALQRLYRRDKVQPRTPPHGRARRAVAWEGEEVTRLGLLEGTQLEERLPQLEVQGKEEGLTA